MNTEVVKSNMNGVQAYDPSAFREPILKSNFTVPKVLLMQGSSEFVKKDRIRAPGDIALSTTRECLGNDKQPLEFIPLSYVDQWMLSEDEKGKGDKKDFKFRGYEPRTAANENAEWEFIKDGTKWKRTKVLQVFALLPRDLEKAVASVKKFEETGEIDLNDVVMPVLISFKNTSFKGGKDVIAMFVRADESARKYKKEIHAYHMTMRLEVLPETSNEGDDYFVMRAMSVGPTKKEYLQECKNWRDTLTQLGDKVKVDNSDEGGAATEEVPF